MSGRQHPSSRERPRRHRRPILWIIPLALLPLNLAGQQTTPLRMEDALNSREFGQHSAVEFSGDGKWLAYASRANRGSKSVERAECLRTGVPEAAKGSDISIVSVETGEARNLTEGKGDNWAPAWSPNGRYLAFLSNRDGSLQANVWVWRARENTLSKVSDASVRAGKIRWSPNSEKIAVTALPERFTPQEYADHVLQPGASGDEATTAVLYRSLAAIEGHTAPVADPWSLEGYRSDLLLLDVRNGSGRRIVRDRRIAQFAFSPRGSLIAFTSPERFEETGSQQILWNLDTATLTSGQITTLASHVRLGFAGESFSWSPDGSLLAYQLGGMKANGDCYVVGRGLDVPKNLTKFPPGRESPRGDPPLWDDSGTFVYLLSNDELWRASLDGKGAERVARIPDHRFIELAAGRNHILSPDDHRFALVLTYDNARKRSGFFKIDLATAATPAKLLEQDRWFLGNGVGTHIYSAPDGSKFAYFAQDAQHDNDLWVSDSGFQHPRRLTHLNPQFDKYRMGSARLIEWRSLDGDVLHGALLLPSDYQEGKRYPLIVWVYGGSRGSDYLNLFGFGVAPVFNLQLLATRGYAVLFPDAPQRLGRPMTDLAQTVLPGVNRVIELGIADPDRLAVMGHSYGGYSTLSLLVQTKRFKVAVVECGTGDLIGQFGQMARDGSAFGISITEQGQGLMGGTPWQVRERYLENSPFFYLDRVETPLLIVHGSEDQTVAPFLADELFVALRRLGKDVQYAKYGHEGHSPAAWTYENQFDLCKRILAWFDQYLKSASE